MAKAYFSHSSRITAIVMKLPLLPFTLSVCLLVLCQINIELRQHHFLVPLVCIVLMYESSLNRKFTSFFFFLNCSILHMKKKSLRSERSCGTHVQ